MNHNKMWAWFSLLALAVGLFPLGLLAFAGLAIGLGFPPPPGLFGSSTSGFASSAFTIPRAEAAYRFADFEGRPPVHIYRAAAANPQGLTPTEIKKAYDLPTTGGSGTIAIIDSYDDASIESDLGVFDKQYGLAACTTKNGCFEKHKMATSTMSDSGWALEESLDVEWAHAIAPKAKILLIEAKTESGQNLLDAIDYATSRKDVVAVSMSWGGAEFSDELSYDSHFARNGSTASSSLVMPDSGGLSIIADTSSTKSKTSPIAFFASSGDDGTGASWPASSPYVIGVGGTTLTLATSTGKFIKETAWSGSGGGISAYEKEPSYQTSYDIPKANGMRAIPDVSYDADPATGYPVYKSGSSKSSSSGTSKNGWYTVGGTSAGAPQWAGIQSLGLTLGGATNGLPGLGKIYDDKASSGTAKFFRDITSGKNGTCTYYCAARKRYDYVTGLGAPKTVKF